MARLGGAEARGGEFVRGGRRQRAFGRRRTAETGSLERAPEKLRRKGADFLVANDVSEAGSGFGTDTNRVQIRAADGTSDELPLLSKRDVAHHILNRVAGALDARDALAHTGRPRTES